MLYIPDYSIKVTYIFEKQFKISFIPGGPNPRTRDQYWSTACEEPGCTAGGEQRAREASSAAPHHSHYFMNHPPHCSHYRLNHPCTPPLRPPLHGKIVFQGTNPWCQKCWGPLLYRTFLFSKFLFVLVGESTSGSEY